MKIKKLDTIRAFAALYVMIAHFGMGFFKGTNYSIPFRFAQEAVMLFFLLSGFVIYISFIKNPNISFKSLL